VGIQPDPPGPIEKRIRKLEDMIRALINKLPAGPPTPEEVEDIQTSLTPFRERKEHPGECEDVHKDQSHEEWEETS